VHAQTLEAMNGALKEQRDALASLVADLDESSSYWSEYEVPLGIVERIKEAAKMVGGRAPFDAKVALGMADCMEMLRSEMLAAGVIEESVPPMFFPENIIPRLLKLAELEGQEPVAAQCRFTDSRDEWWRWCDLVHHRYVQAHPSEWAGYETRALYTRPVLAEPVNTRLLAALRFYAEGHHFIRHDTDAWDTVSGEPQNFLEDEANTATVEDGSLAKAALSAIG